LTKPHQPQGADTALFGTMVGRGGSWRKKNGGTKDYNVAGAIVLNERIEKFRGTGG